MVSCADCGRLLERWWWVRYDLADAMPSDELPEGAIAPLHERHCARCALKTFMSAISERNWCAGWLSGLEWELWDALVGSPRTTGVAPVNPDDIATLRRLADEAAGWWEWPDGAHEERFVPLEAWERRWREHPRNRDAAHDGHSRPA